MIGKSVGAQFVPSNSVTGIGPLRTEAGASTPGDPADTLSLRPPLPSDSGGPLLTLQPPHAVVLSAEAPEHVASPPAERLARARAVISDFVTSTGRLIAGSDNQQYLAGRAARLEKSLNAAIVDGKSHAELASLAETAFKVHYELSQSKGISQEAQLKLLQKCLDMYDGVERIVTPRTLHYWDVTKEIAYKAYLIQFKLATGMDVTWDVVRHLNLINLTPKGKPRATSEVDLLGYARAASLFRRARCMQRRPELNQIYTAHQLRHMPIGIPIDGNRLTSQEIHLWCSEPPQNPWPVEPRLEGFYEAAKLAARQVRAAETNALRREALAQHMPHNPDPELAVRDNRDNVADLIAGFSADMPDDRG